MAYIGPNAPWKIQYHPSIHMTSLKRYSIFVIMHVVHPEKNMYMIPTSLCFVMVW